MDRSQSLRTIIYKDMLDLRWNGQVIVLLFCQVLIHFGLYNLDVQNVLPSFFAGFIATLLTMYVQGNLIVEESEQGTLKLLYQMKVHPIDIFIAKSVLTFTLSTIVFVVSAIVYGYTPISIFAGLLFISPLLLMFLCLGTILGTMSKNTIDVSLYGWPVILIYFLLEGIVSYNTDSNPGILLALPNYHMFHGLQLIEQQEVASAFAQHMYVPIGWALLIVMLTVRMIRRLFKH
ncbi:ABC transporter permease [Salicibibacter cibarius]|uniref:ABC transporter permease n=1 Tax=Salicibibacter cibarius TaxID=2743000 RepID=A0A7T6Z0V0_9BACI|nr:ABC transporter permease [Salicibibacter cibarius]QQK74881.1 ABC transporter permease [Salicibibacter cibarius]